MTSKSKLMCTLDFSIFLFACESCSLTTDLLRHIETLEMSCYCTILDITHRDQITNKEVWKEKLQPLGYMTFCFTLRGKIMSYGHIRSSKTILQCLVPECDESTGKWRKCRKVTKRKIRKWTYLFFVNSYSAVHDRDWWQVTANHQLIFYNFTLGYVFDDDGNGDDDKLLDRRRLIYVLHMVSYILHVYEWLQ